MKPPESTSMMIHIGRKVPKDLLALGWREGPQAMHLGRGIWLFVLHRLPGYADAE